MSIVLLGAQGQVGRALTQTLADPRLCAAFTHSTLDLTDHAVVHATLKQIRPDVIINAAAYTAVDRAESDPVRAHAVNAHGVANLASVAAEIGAWLVHYSTDYVFDGTKDAPYLESDTPNPLNVYGASKLLGEQSIQAAGGQHLIFRTSWVIGADGSNFAKTMLRLAGERDRLRVVSDQLGVPTAPQFLARVTAASIDSLESGMPWDSGIYHAAPNGVTNWHAIAQSVLMCAHQQGLSLRAGPGDVEAITTDAYPTPARRPLNSRLDTQKLQAQLPFLVPHWMDDFSAVIAEIITQQTRKTRTGGLNEA